MISSCNSLRHFIEHMSCNSKTSSDLYISPTLPSRNKPLARRVSSIPISQSPFCPRSSLNAKSLLLKPHEPSELNFLITSFLPQDWAQLHFIFLHCRRIGCIPGAWCFHRATKSTMVVHWSARWNCKQE